MTWARHLVAGAVVAGLLSSVAVTGQDAPVQEGRFTFRDNRSRAIAVALVEGEGAITMAWPAIAGESWDTALLGVQLSVDPGAQAPYVEIAAGDRSDRQYVAPGDSGLRWLNVSFLCGMPDSAMQLMLRGAGVKVAAGAATLRTFASRPDLTKSILILAPHPDDAEIAAFGVYAHRNASVVTVTAGNAGAPTYESVFDDLAELYLFKGHIRVIDSITVPWQGGIPPERTFNMGYFDARLAEMYTRRGEVVPEMYRPNSDIGVYRKDNVGSLLPKRSRESEWGNLVDDTLSLLKKVKPAVIVAPHPQLDSHRDHQFTAVALAEALSRWRKPVTLLLYTNHAESNRYPYGPAGTLMSLPRLPAGEVLLDRVYSHPLTPGLQRLKLFALESMHDLRFTPTRQYQLAVDDQRASAPERVGPGPDITYLRRAPRSNELFYVYDQDTFALVIQEFLKGRAPPVVSR